MLPTADYARQLDFDLDSIGNGPDAVASLVAALNFHPASDEPEFTPGPEDWMEYELYLDRLETEERLGINARFV